MGASASKAPEAWASGDTTGDVRAPVAADEPWCRLQADAATQATARAQISRRISGRDQRWPHHPAVNLATLRDRFPAQVHVLDRKVEFHPFHNAVTLPGLHVLRSH